MIELTIAVEGKQNQFEPGEVVDIRAKWKCDFPLAALEVRLVWHTECMDEEPSAIVISQSSRIESPEAEGTHRCQLPLPETPFGFLGKLISLKWGVELVTFPDLEAVRLDLSVGPGGKPRVLHPAE